MAKANTFWVEARLLPALTTADATELEHTLEARPGFLNMKPDNETEVGPECV